MRKHSPRKWLHAVLDLLPLIIIPIFAIYSHRHTIDNYAIEVSQNEIVDFNQTAQANRGGTDNGYTFISQQDGSYIANGTGTSTIRFTITNVDTIMNHVYYFATSSSNVCLEVGGYSATRVFDNGIVNNTYSTNPIYITIVAGTTLENEVVIPQIIDLTKMFGSGNEPTLSDFRNWYPLDYYEYTLSKKELLKDVGTITYNDTDIGSQFTYALYKPINQYFNLSQVGVFGQLYDFLQVNMFNGNAPISIFIVYHVILYEFIMDLIFLIYCVFMFIIDFAEKMLDSFFDMSFGGGKR